MGHFLFHNNEIAEIILVLETVSKHPTMTGVVFSAFMNEVPLAHPPLCHGPAGGVRK